MKKQETRSVQQNMLFNTVGSILYYFCVWLSSVLIVRMSGFTDAGIFSVAMTVTASPAIIALFNVRSYQVSDINGQYSDRTYIRSRVVTNALAFAVCAVMVLLYGYDLQKAAVVLVYMVFKLVEGAADVYYGIDQKMARLDYAGISLSVRGVGSLAAFIGVFFLTKSLLASVAGMTVVSLLVVVFYDKKIAMRLSEEKNTECGISSAHDINVPNASSIEANLHGENACGVNFHDENLKAEKAHDKKDDYTAVKSLLITCLPLAIVAFLNNLSLTVPRTYLERFYGEEVMGYYASVSSPTIVIQLAAMTLFAPLVPILTQKYVEKNKKDFLKILGKFTALIAALTVLAIILCELLGDWALRLVFGDEIGPYVYLFLPIILSAVLIAVNASLFSICTLMRIIKPQYTIGIAGFLSAIICSYTVVRTNSMDGVVWALFISLLIQIAIQLVLIIHGLRKHMRSA